jgi:drug/metabolite transporter (DMT)-like permease
LCGEGAIMSTAERTHVSEATIWVSALCCLLTLIAVVLNYRDKRTGIAIGLVLAGTACIIFSVLKGGGMPLYYTGVGLLFAGAWMNASLMYVLEKLRNMRGYNLARNQITGR